MRRDLFVYLSGPITARDGVMVEENVAAGAKVHFELIRAGIPNFCPQLTGMFPTAHTDVPYERWMQFDFAVIDRCTHVLMLPRWETSKGAKLEKVYAEQHGKPVIYSIDALLLGEVQA